MKKRWIWGITSALCLMALLTGAELFSHEVTVRPMANGSFQYVSNRVTAVGPWGLPPDMPRFELDGEE